MKTTAGLIAAWVAAMPMCAHAEIEELKIPKGAGGLGFLSFVVMEKQGLIEKHAKAAGIDNLKVTWVNVGGPAQVNDALLSGSAHLAVGGPPGFLLLWDRTRTSMKVMGLTAMTSMPMYLNTRAPDLKSIDEIRPTDKIAITAVKASIPAILMQMYARSKFGADKTYHFDPMTVTMTHPDSVAALLSGVAEINLHYASPPFHQRERRDSRIRTLQTSNDVMGGSTTFTMVYVTTAFTQQNPKTTHAIVAAVNEANAMITSDKDAAAEAYLDSVGRKGWTKEEILEVLADPDVKYTTTPENVMKYADFMNSIGSIKAKPASLSDVFLPDANIKGGN
jgi:NitT/TauT family transport system substrate-binding protein